MKTCNRLIGALAAAALAFTTAAGAAEWPTKPITIVVPFASGGANDIIARLIADPISKELKQPVVVENRAGAGGMVGSAQVARAKPDGYTFVMAGVASHAIAPAINPNAGYDPIRDFTHIAYIGGPPLCWVVTPSSDMFTLNDVLSRARAGKLAGYASSGVGTLGHLVSEFVLQKAGVRLDHIPYSTAALGDIIAGHVQLGSYTWTAVLGSLQGKSLRGIAITTEKRPSGFPDLPTFKELGYDLVASTWFSLAGPAGLPSEITERVNRAVMNALKTPDVRKRLDQDAIETKAMTPEELTAYYQAEIARWKPIAIGAGMSR